MSDSTPRAAAEPRESAFGLFISFALFAYFGFAARFLTTQGPGGPVVPLFAFFVWSLRIAAVGFAIALLLHLLRRREADLVAGFTGIFSSVTLLAAAVWDLLDTSRGLAIHPMLLLLFAAWNGYVSWSSLFAGRTNA